MKEAKNYRKEKLIKVIADFANKKNILLFIAILCSFSILIVYQEAHLSPLIQKIESKNSSIYCAQEQSKESQFCTTVFFDQSNEITVTFESLPENVINLFYIIKFLKKNDAKSFQDQIAVQIHVDPLDENNQIDNTKQKLELEQNINVRCFNVEDQFCKEDLFFRQDILYKKQRTKLTANLNEKQLKEFDGMILDLYQENNDVIKYDRMVRMSMIFLSIIFGLFYIYTYQFLPQDMITFEHQFIFFLSFGLIISNDPLYLFGIDYYIEFVIFQSFQISFYILIVVFALSMLDRIYKEPLRLQSESITIKLVSIGVLLTTILTGLFLQFMMNGQDKTVFQMFVNNEEIKCLLIFGFFAFHVYLLYEMDIWDQILPRHKFLMSISISLLLIYLTCSIFQIYYLPFILLNLYVIILQIGWQIPEEDMNSPMFLSNKQTIQTQDHQVELQNQESYDETDPELEINSEVQSQLSLVEEI